MWRVYLDGLAAISFKSGNMVGSTACVYCGNYPNLTCMSLVPFSYIVGVFSGPFPY